MGMLHLRCAVLMVLVAILGACSSTAPPRKATIALPEPNPLKVTAVQDSAATVTAAVPLIGGTLEATGADGTVFRLSIPTGALLAPVTVSMTPLVSLEGSPVEGNMQGVALEPGGLRLYDVATLEIVPANGGATSAIGFAALDDGSAFHLVPPAAAGDGESVTLNLLHFSLHGAYLGSDAAPYSITGSPDDFAPGDWEALQDHMLGDPLASERTADLLGEEGDPALAEQLEAILNTFYEQSVAPILTGIAGNCASMEAHGSKVLGWTRSVQLAGMESTFTNEISQVETAVRAGAHRCWEEAIAPCIDPEAASYARVLETARLNLLVGGSSAEYDPAREDLQCEGDCPWVADVTAIELEFKLVYQLSGNVLGDSGAIGESLRQWTATAMIPLDTVNSSETVAGFRAYSDRGDPMEVTYAVDSTIMHEGELRDSTQGSGTVPPGSASLTVGISTTSCVLAGTFTLNGPVEIRHYNPDSTETRQLLLASATMGRQPLTPGVSQGTATLPADNSDPNFSFSASVDPVLSAFWNTGNRGDVQIEWTVTMITGP